MTNESVKKGTKILRSKTWRSIWILSFGFWLSGCASAVDVGPPGTQPQAPLAQTSGGLPIIYSGVVFINVSPFTWDDYNGKRLLLALFDFNNEQENQYIANLNTIYASLDRRKEELIGIHVPAENVFFSVAELRRLLNAKRIQFPVIVDADHLIWAGLGRYKKPFLVQVDRSGKVNKFIQTGEIIALLVKEYKRAAPDRLTATVLEPDILCGAEKGKIGNSEDKHAYVPFVYIHSGDIPVAGIIYLSGEWTNRQNSYYYNGGANDGYIGFRFFSSEVSLLAQRGRAKITLDGEPIPVEYQGDDVKTDGNNQTYIDSSSKRIYDVIKNLPWHPGTRVMKIYPQQEFEIFRVIFPVGDNWKLP